MSTTGERTAVAEFQQELPAFRRGWRWFVLLGTALVVVGGIALGSLVLASLATAAAIGVLLLVSGAVEAIGSVWYRSRRSVFLHLLAGVLSVVVGAMFLWAPVDAVLALALLLMCLLTAGGVFRIIAGLSHRSGAQGWPPVNGGIDLILAMLIWMGWPASALWVLGLVVGISLVFRGLNWIGLGLALRHQGEAPGELFRAA
jgi:uncharacterized membrane protein HdeD (DUF308 family)